MRSFERLTNTLASLPLEICNRGVAVRAKIPQCARPSTACLSRKLVALTSRRANRFVARDL